MTEKNYQNMNPTELLREQVQLLAELNHNIGELKKQQEQHTEIVTKATKKVLERLGNLEMSQSPLNAPQLDVAVTDIPMTITKMANFMVKWAIAAIPAAITFFLLALIVSLVLGGIFS